VAVDLSSEGLEDVRREQAVEATLAEQALREFEMENSSPDVPRLSGPSKESDKMAPFPATTSNRK
jgi:hypothetical protein